jgi:two-component system response regulator FixJ
MSVRGNHLVAVIEDDDDLRDALAQLLAASGNVVRSYATVEGFLADVLDHRPNCVLADVRLGQGMDGVTLLHTLRDRGCDCPVIMLTGHADVDLAVRAMRAGALDLIEKPFANARLLAAVAEACTADRQTTTPVVDARLRTSTLTPRELQVLQSLVEGNANKVVAHELGITPRTVAAHRAALMEKLGVRSFAAAVRIAVAAGIVDEDEPRRLPPSE